MGALGELLAVLTCPKCRGSLHQAADGQGVLCRRCQLIYPVRDNVPVMIVGEASAAAYSESRAADEGQPTDSIVTLEIVEGASQGMEIELPRGSCRAVARAADAHEKTLVFDSGGSLTLDEGTKQLVLTYITQQFQSGLKESEASRGSITAERLGSFRRLPDISLADEAISRLHAMIFHGQSGVGVLDLVSKNGTFVNGAEVESKLLKPGDVIAVGGTKIRVGQISQ